MKADAYDAMRRLEDTHWWYKSLRLLTVKRLEGAQSILDAGCGTGGLLAQLDGKTAVGLDCSPLALSHCRERGLKALVEGSVENMPFAGGSFDAVAMLDVLYHKNVADQNAVLGECSRVLTPGGMLIMQVPAFDSLRGAHDEHVEGARRYTRRGVKKLLEQAGFLIVELSYRNAIALPFAFLSRRLNTGKNGGDLRGYPAWLNGPLYWLALAENLLLERVGVPLGLSVWAVARKKA